MQKENILTINGLTKQYPGTLALSDVSININKGEIIGLVGENGAGKSTLLKLIMGLEQPTKGDMQIYGKKYNPKTPLEANKNGIGMVFQEQSLIQNLSVSENIFFGREDSYSKFGFVNKNKMNKDAEEVLSQVNVSGLKTSKKVFNYDFATRQMIEIAKVFYVSQRDDEKNSIILLDEPTSVLSEDEVKLLFKNIKKFVAKGDSVIFVSHRLDEVLEISDRIYVFKDGQNVCELNKENANENILYEKMVGKTASGEYYKLNRQVTPSKKELMKIEKLGLKGYFNDISFSLHEGEVIGICGVIGSGKEELCEVICGDKIPTSGTIKIHGEEKVSKEPYQSLRNGILSIPKERREEAIIPDNTISENISMSNYSKIKLNGFISKKKEDEQAQTFMEELNIKAPSIFQKVSNLSGGNAQKVVFARILASDAPILLLNHPTRGVDIGAKEEIYSLIRDLSEQNKGIIVIGDTLDESIGLSSKILVMKDGTLTHEFDAPSDNKPEQLDIVKYMM
ncbi:MAG: sugar ABC transporter ATP-binding protein [Pleomorphochaeta sp.]|nr:sugar ABC transporter ATP-binding protein [Sphaerochaetaceae bacterium]